MLASAPSTASILTQLLPILGPRLCAYIASLPTTNDLTLLFDPLASPTPEVACRLSETLAIISTMTPLEAPSVIQTWLQALDPFLFGQSPARLLREGDENDRALVALAAQAFLASF